jgi:hypothetical protein
MAWLRAGVPISLIADLAAPRGPLSREILASEALPADVAAAAHTAGGASPGTSSEGEGNGFSRAQASW